MTILASAFLLLFLGFGAQPFSVLPLWSTPTHPLYLQTVPALLSGAEEEVLVALSDMRAYSDGTTEPFLSALTDAAARGVQVYVLMERSTRPFFPEQEAALEKLRRAGVQVGEDSPDITLHAKFIVIDKQWVIVGSTHWTKTALTGSVQVDLVLQDPELGALFRRFFFYLWEGRVDTKTHLPPPPWPEPSLVPLLDFPEAKTTFVAIDEVLRRAESEIFLLLYQVTLYPQYPESPSTLLLRALAGAAQRGLRVRVLLEGGEGDPSLGETNRLSGAWLAAHGVEVRFDPTPITMHAKCLMVDNHHFLVSSANWNYSSLVKNAETGVLLLGVPQLAQLFSFWFAELWELSRPLH